jgi:hypothetical protein
MSCLMEGLDFRQVDATLTHCQDPRPKTIAQSDAGLFGITGPMALTYRRLTQLLEYSPSTGTGGALS